MGTRNNVAYAVGKTSAQPSLPSSLPVLSPGGGSCKFPNKYEIAYGQYTLSLSPMSSNVLGTSVTHFRQDFRGGKS
jgi:hypothetical protein